MMKKMMVFLAALRNAQDGTHKGGRRAGAVVGDVDDGDAEEGSGQGDDMTSVWWCCGRGGRVE